MAGGGGAESAFRIPWGSCPTPTLCLKLPQPCLQRLGTCGVFPPGGRGPLPVCPLQTPAGCIVLGMVCRPQFCPQYCSSVCGILPPEPQAELQATPHLRPPRWSAELGSELDAPPPRPYTSQTPQAQASLFPVRVGSFCGCPIAESWSQMNKPKVVGQVQDRSPMEPGLGDTLMSAAAPPVCRVM